MRFLFFLLFLFQVYAGFSQLIPTPTTFQQTDAIFNFENLSVAQYQLSEDEILLFNHYGKKLYDFKLHVTQSKKKSTIFFEKLTGQHPQDFYTMHVTNSDVKINFTSPASKLYAWNSLLQLVQDNNGKYRINGCVVKDYPKFSWRGLHLDVARHFFTVNEVKKYIDLMAFYKFNIFHWQLTDDQAWRIEIKRYPKLTSIGSHRDSTAKGPYQKNPTNWDYTPETGFYTQDEIKEVIDYAQKRHVVIVPEIEMPGHARAAIAAYPELSCTGKQIPIIGNWGVFEEIFCSKASTIQFLQHVLDEVAELFPGEYIHIGGDEAPKIRWEKCENCQQVMHENKLENEHELQSYFIHQMDEFLTKKGKKLIGWDEILEGGLSENAAVMSWRGFEGGIAAANQNHKVVMTPTSHCYFDYYQSDHANEPLAIGGYTPLQKVYDFNPIPSKLAQDKHQYILGGQANLWTEYISDFNQVEYMVYPRALALSQVLWSVSKPDYDVFLQDFTTNHEEILHAMGVNYAHSIYNPQFKIQRTSVGISALIHGIKKNQVYHVEIIDLDNSSVLKQYELKNNEIITLNRPVAGISKTLNYIITGAEFPDTISKKFQIHSGLGLPIQLDSLPSKAYNTGGSLTLVDGILGNRPWKGSDWLGFQKSQVVFVLDLQSTKSISSASLSFLNANSSWIYLPKTIEVLVSNDGIDWESANTVNVEQELQKIEIKQVAQYIKFVVKAMKTIPKGMIGAGFTPWTFIDEVLLDLEKD